jgi:hypothetical protein
MVVFTIHSVCIEKNGPDLQTRLDIEVKGWGWLSEIRAELTGGVAAELAAPR